MNFGTTEIVLILAVLVFVLVVPLAVIATIVIGVSKRSRKNSRKCPFCAEIVQTEAVVCRFCGRDIPISMK